MDSSRSSNGAARIPDRDDPGPQTRPIVLAGGQSLVRATRRSVLSRAGLDVVADVADAAAAAEAAKAHGAGLVLLDSDVSGGCGSAVRRIGEEAPDTHVLVVAPELERERLLAAIRAGALGFVAETLGASGLVRAVEVALSGESVIPRAGVSTFIELLRGSSEEETLVDGLRLQLTRREVEVVTRLREGMTPKEIAYELDLSDVTVRRHMSSVARKARQARPLTLALESTS
ncbi:MAG TPA: response regulator transcription factor [Gaiellaceae bacterium]|nr:response regulator transcription factor [Gaiellaceae bacterium]